MPSEDCLGQPEVPDAEKNLTGDQDDERRKQYRHTGHGAERREGDQGNDDEDGAEGVLSDSFQNLADIDLVFAIARLLHPVENASEVASCVFCQKPASPELSNFR
jgi:hypothetical protein